MATYHRLEIFLQLAEDINASVDTALSPIGLTRATWRVLRAVERRGPLSQSWLALRCGCGPSNVTRVVDRLVQQGLVARTPSDTDRRQILAALTPAGTAALADADVALADLEADLAARVTSAQATTQHDNGDVDSSFRG